MHRNFRSAKGDGGGGGSAAGAGAAAPGCDVVMDALVGPDETSAPGCGAAATFDRTTILVLTRMTDLRGGDCVGVFDCTAGPAFASFTVTTDRPWLLHHFQKNQPEHASVTTTSSATAERRK